MILTDLTPGLVMIVAAAGVPYLKHHLRQVFMLGAILLSALSLTAGAGEHLVLEVLGQDLILHRADNLTLPFGIVFHLAAFLNVIYGWHERRSMEHTAGLAYGGAAIAAVHGGDLISLFIWWELTAISSVFLILAAGTRAAQSAAVRYLAIQVLSGVLLLAGAAFYWRESGSLAFDAMTLGSVGTWLIFVAFGIKAAFPFLNGWLQDAYPEASVIGTVMLSAFTTKLAVYAFARGFAGTEILIWIGAVMTAFPVFFAVIENDLRRVLSYSLNNQLGFMIVAVGIGSELAINGAFAHAFAHIIYKSLLFMSMGAVLYRVGTAKASELGGLYHSMPWTMVFCVIGAMSISAFPLLSGFVAKSLIMSALGYEGLVVIYLILLAASAGVLEHSGIKIPYFSFFAHDGGHRVKEAPINMLIAMGIAAAACIGIGVMPQAYYQLLPYATSYQPYDSSHVIGQLELLIFAGLAFVVLIRLRIYPPEIRSTVLNSDWLYRRLGFAVVRSLAQGGLALGRGLMDGVDNLGRLVIAGAGGIAKKGRPVILGQGALVQLALLIALLVMVLIYARDSALDEVRISTPSGDVSLLVEIADEPHERTEGLKYRKDLASGHGMLFVFEDDLPRSFWMKDTPLSLDILFFDSDGGYVSGHFGTEPYSLDSLASEGSARYALEVRAGDAEALSLGVGSVLDVKTIDLSVGSR